MALGTVAAWFRSRGSTAPSWPRSHRAAPARERRAHRADGRRPARRPAEPWHLGFLLGPRINAGGRISRATLGVDLLLQDDPAECARLAAELDRLNRERQAIELATLAQAEAEAQAALGAEEKGAVVVTAAEGWHPGVVGLVAARLKEKYGRPAFAIALEPGGIGTGSGRSITGVDLGRVVRRAVSDGLLIKGGGHAMAAGVTLRKGALAGFRAYLENALTSVVETARRDEALLIDGALTAAAADVETVATIARGPLAPAIPEPVIALPLRPPGLRRRGGAGARAGTAAGRRRLDRRAIAFRAAGQKLGQALAQHRGRAVHAAGVVRRPLERHRAGAAAPDRHRGGRRLVALRRALAQPFTSLQNTSWTAPTMMRAFSLAML